MSRAPTLIGFVPKQKVLPPAWLKVGNLTEICSVTPCLHNEPAGLANGGPLNDFSLFDSAAVAEQAIAGNPARTACAVYALRLVPTAFDEGEEVALDLPPLNVSEPPASFRRLGFDAVGFFFNEAPGVMPSFTHSPLYCNRLAQETPVNQYCLLDEPEAALQLARRYSIEKPEPGKYVAVEVLRG